MQYWRGNQRIYSWRISPYYWPKWRSDGVCGGNETVVLKAAKVIISGRTQQPIIMIFSTNQYQRINGQTASGVMTLAYCMT